MAEKLDPEELVTELARVRRLIGLGERMAEKTTH
jgi:hypothetical protein